ncbi:hypothetical protein QWY99_03435 [Flavobacterium branchiarum]|uniref:Uncharacterized protein n=1 Tax=Flavobacterium branchiarum TaxID=1114870 RepID=A0ABV5FPC9_9FLAO|nr:hypothetical protein [Flavobacterium branchiarum]MDN3672121.1 hypothetical protein [Flavobacterium branchiarum]
MTKKLARLGHPVFLVSLIILFFNDLIFKDVFHNYLTGKLSDFSGLFAFSFFWGTLFIERSRAIHLGVTLFFIFWKSSFSEVFIDFFGLYRVVDFSDNVALVSILLSYKLLQKVSVPVRLHPVILRFVFLLSCFSFIATTQRPSYREYRIDDDFLNLNLKNESGSKIVVLIDFKYSERELAIYKKRQIELKIKRIKKQLAMNSGGSQQFKFEASDSLRVVEGVNENWVFRLKTSDFLPLVLDVDAIQFVKLPLDYKDTLIGFPSNFKISILDSNWKVLKTYDKKAFFEKINNDFEKPYNEYSRPESFNFIFGKTIVPVLLANCYGRWESEENIDLSKIEINSRYCINNVNGDVYDCKYSNDSIFVHTPNKIYVGAIKNSTAKKLEICWDGKRVVAYKKSSKPPILGGN